MGAILSKDVIKLMFNDYPQGVKCINMKYILYKTTNLINGFIYIGVHQTLNPYIFDGYIGNGVYVNKPSSYQNPKTAFQLAVSQFGPYNFKRELLSVYNIQEEAYLAEAMIVNPEFLARDDVYNMILGGIGGGTKRVPCYQYDTTGNFIREWGSISDASTSLGYCETSVWNALVFHHKCGDFYWSYTSVPKIDVSKFNDRNPSINVYRYKLTGEFDTEFKSLSEAALNTECTLVQVARSARLGYRVGQFQFCFIKQESYDKAKSIYIKTRPVFKYSSEGNFLEEYATQKEAEFKNPYSNITKSIKNKKPCVNGFLWSLEKLPKFCSTVSKKKKVGMFDLDGNMVKEWESVKKCSEEYGIVKNYIKTQKIYKKQYIFKYI